MGATSSGVHVHYPQKPAEFATSPRWTGCARRRVVVKNARRVLPATPATELYCSSSRGQTSAITVLGAHIPLPNRTSSHSQSLSPQQHLGTTATHCQSPRRHVPAQRISHPQIATPADVRRAAGHHTRRREKMAAISKIRRTHPRGHTRV